VTLQSIPLTFDVHLLSLFIVDFYNYFLGFYLAIKLPNNQDLWAKNH
jgi:hypothetical protein